MGTSDDWDYEHGDIDFYDALLENGPPPEIERRKRQIREWMNSYRLGFYPPGILGEMWPSEDDPLEPRALSVYVRHAWAEAALCYIGGLYAGAIILGAAALEGALQHRIFSEDPNWARGRHELGKCIPKANEMGILPDRGASIRQAAQIVLGHRNDFMHANLERQTPSEALSPARIENRVIGYYEPDEDGDSGHITITGFVRYQSAAIDVLRETSAVLDYLFPDEGE